MGDLDSSATVEITGKIMVLAIITLFIVVVFILFLHLYAKWFSWRIEETTAPQPPRRRSRRGRHLIFTPPPPPSQGPAARLRRGLDPSVLNFLPAVVFKSQEFKDDLECAVCLSEVVEGEKARLLPNCNHGFHVDCIDMWFHSHSTCPLCRSPVAPPPLPHHSSAAAAATCSQHHHTTLDDDLEQVIISTAIPSPPEEISSVSGYPTAESPNFSTNVSVWGVQTQVSTGPGPAAGCCLEEGASSTTQSSSYSSSSSSSSSASSSLERNRQDQNLVIDIPMRTSTDMNSATEEERKTTPTTPARLRSLKRLLSRDKRGPPSSPSASNSSTICVEV